MNPEVQEEFAKTAKEQGWIENFCSEVAGSEDEVQACQAMVAESLTDDEQAEVMDEPQQPQGRPEPVQHEPEPEPEVPGYSDEITTIMADCVGEPLPVVGLTRNANPHACMRAVEKLERRDERVQDRLDHLESQLQSPAPEPEPGDDAESEE